MREGGCARKIKRVIKSATVWRRLIGCLKLQVMFRLKAPLGQKEQLIIGLFCPKGYEDKAPYAYLALARAMVIQALENVVAFSV